MRVQGGLSRGDSRGQLGVRRWDRESLPSGAVDGGRRQIEPSLKAGSAGTSENWTGVAGEQSRGSRMHSVVWGACRASPGS